MLLLALGIVIFAVSVLVLYVFITWEHELFHRLQALPAPHDLGTKEFEFRCIASGIARVGWKKSVLHSPCPRITVQSPFVLLSSDLAKLTSSLGIEQLELKQIPLIYPQIAASCMLLQILGNSNFPTSVRNLHLKAIFITQLRPINLHFKEPQVILNKEEKSTSKDSSISCVMVLVEKNFVENAIEFAIQTDLFDDMGILWQSTTYFVIPFKQKVLTMQLNSSNAQLDPDLLQRTYKSKGKTDFACSRRQLIEYSEVSSRKFMGTNENATPLMWMLGRALGEVEKLKSTPQFPVQCKCVFDVENATNFPLDTKLASETLQSTDEKPVTKFLLHRAGVNGERVVTGLIRSVGWRHTTE